MDLGIKDRVAIVGGASKGLGRACAKRLLDEGAKVVLCARTQKTLEATADTLRSATGGEATPVISDWSKIQDIDLVVSKTMDTYGRIDILVQNTGGPPPGAFFDHPEEHWQDAFELLLLSAVRMYRRVIPHMKRNGWGRIVNIASVTVKEPLEWQSLILSSVFRSGLTSLAKTLSKDLARDNILINTVCPGLYKTERMAQVLENQAQASGMKLEEMIARYAHNIPVGRLGEPDELADLVAFLASDLASNITGVTIQADGGAVKGLL